MIRFTLLMIIAYLLTRCGHTARQAQNLSDGLAGIEVVQLRVADDAVAHDVLDGAHGHVAAIAAGEILPPPIHSPEAIITDLAAYRAVGQQAMVDVATTVFWWGWALGVLSAALGVVRMIPGPSGALADLALAGACPQGHAPG